jgi:nondiscriminating glutamyl-tRNA synthetase
MKDFTENVIVRMAPSPTGNLHIGTARTTLFNYLFAKKHGGKFILRIEDTDKERSTKEFENNILEGLEWLGLKRDEFFRQSERTEIYKTFLQKMIDDEVAYVSKETPQEEGQRAEVIRFKNPRKKIKFTDLVRGEVEFDTTELGDFVIAKSLEEPLYHLAVVVDDHQMGITHVIRGEDHISNTPRQILIQEGIGAKRPVYAHLPLIFDKDKKKLSKRTHGERVSIDFYKKEGYLPEALLNFLVLMGWNPGTNEEIFTLEELTNVFDIKGVQKSGAIFDETKLRWINKEHIKKLPSEELEKIISEKILERYPQKHIHQRTITLISERIELLTDIDRLLDQGEFSYFFEAPGIDTSKLGWKGDSTENVKKHLKKIQELLKDADYSSEETIKESLIEYADKEGKGNVLWPLRFALSGKEKSPDPFTLVFVLGKEETDVRIERVLKLI